MLDIIKLAKSIHAFLSEYSFNKRSLRVCSVFLFLGLIFILFSSPKFLIESTLIENRAGFSGQSLGGLSDIIQLSDEVGVSIMKNLLQAYTLYQPLRDFGKWDGAI